MSVPANADSRLAADALIFAPSSNKEEQMAQGKLAKALMFGKSIVLPAAEVEALRARNAALEKVADILRDHPGFYDGHPEGETAWVEDEQYKWLDAKTAALGNLDKVPKAGA